MVELLLFESFSGTSTTISGLVWGNTEPYTVLRKTAWYPESVRILKEIRESHVVSWCGAGGRSAKDE